MKRIGFLRLLPAIPAAIVVIEPLDPITNCPLWGISTETFPIWGDTSMVTRNEQLSRELRYQAHKNITRMKIEMLDMFYGISDA